VFPLRVFRRRRSTLAPHESVEFYPSYGYRTAKGDAWRLVIQGCAFNPKLPWFRRHPVMAVIRRAMRVDRGADEYFRRRMHRFLVDSKMGRQIAVRIDGQTYAVGESDPAGLFRREIEVPQSTIDKVAESSDHGTQWISYTAELPEGDPRTFTGRVQLVEPRGVSIVSDVDDTLKHSNVPNRRDLFRNTFLKEFSPIAGMADLYGECARRGVAFHFVSGSPWQLYEPLSEFFRAHGFPGGSFHLKPFRIRDTARKMRGPSPQLAHKKTAIEPILSAFPRRKFVLIGDSGEQDPLIYGGFLRERSEQIAGVFIRALRDDTASDPRLAAAFQGCPPERWHVYHSPDEIRDTVLRLVEQANA
jgi:phosphatidate phosphatase APP1